VLAFRVERQHLAARADPGALVDVVADLAGVHAQLLRSAELTLHARIDRLAPDAVARALWEERALVKTWAMRGTLHLLPAAELGLWVAAHRVLKPRHHAPAWQRYHGVTRAQVDAALEAIPAVLADGPLTREALADAVAARAGDPGLGDALGAGWGAVLKLAALGDEVAPVAVEGEAAWLLAADVDAVRAAAPTGVVRASASWPALLRLVVRARPPPDREAQAPVDLARLVLELPPR